MNITEKQIKGKKENVKLKDKNKKQTGIKEKQN